jgi:hypothetical protein
MPFKILDKFEGFLALAVVDEVRIMYGLGVRAQGICFLEIKWTL